MQTIFIAGSIAIKNLDPLFIVRIRKIIENETLRIIVGDANGTDKSVQETLIKNKAKNVTVFCSGKKPRNNLGEWPLHSVTTNARKGSRAFFTAKDLEMARVADYGLMMWDSKSTGTLSNVIELIERGKHSAVFVDKISDFIIVKSTEDFSELLKLMSEIARTKAESKIQLSERLTRTVSQQASLAL